jgi:CRP/FNR family cyclic AMP-dependent transcriptional regulator
MLAPSTYDPKQFQYDPRSEEVRALLESTATPFTVAEYPPRAAIFRQGDPCDSVMHIERGRVWLAVTARNGKEAICGLLDTGAFLGEAALAGCRERGHSATAMTPTQVLVVAKAHMIRLLRTQPRLMDRFVEYLLGRHVRLEADLTEQLLYSSEERLAHLLVVLAEGGQRRPLRYALPPVSQEILAEMVGTTRSRVNAFIGKFRQRGFIERHNGLLHVNPGRLRDVHDGDRRIAIAGVSGPEQRHPVRGQQRRGRIEDDVAGAKRQHHPPVRHAGRAERHDDDVVGQRHH